MLLDKIDNPIGLDISELSIKFVQLKRAGADLHLSAFGDIGLPPGLIDNEIIISVPNCSNYKINFNNS